MSLISRVSESAAVACRVDTQHGLGTALCDVTRNWAVSGPSTDEQLKKRGKKESYQDKNVNSSRLRVLGTTSQEVVKHWNYVMIRKHIYRQATQEWRVLDQERTYIKRRMFKSQNSWGQRKTKEIEHTTKSFRGRLWHLHYFDFAKIINHASIFNIYRQTTQEWWVLKKIEL